MKRSLVVAAILALGIGSVSVVHSAFAYNQEGKGTTGANGSGTVNHDDAGNQGNGSYKGNADEGPHRCC